MCRYVRVLALAAIIGLVNSSELRKTKETRHGRIFFDMLGYLHGFKIGKEYALQLAPIFVPTPIIVLPSYNQQQSVSIQKGTTEENYQEMGGTIQTITTSAKLIDTTKAPANDDAETVRQSPKREIGGSESIGQLRQQTIKPNTTDTNSSVTVNETSTTPMMLANNVTTAATESTLQLMNMSGKYPAAVKNNVTVDNLTITTEAPKGNTDTSSNLSTPIAGANSTESENFTMGEIGWSLPVTYPSSNANGVYGVPYPYPAATYDNTFLNHLVLTTDVPKNAEALPPKGDQRWQQFSSVKNSLALTEGFRPLAGLYYDGFLHTPLWKKNGWSPNF